MPGHQTLTHRPATGPVVAERAPRARDAWATPGRAARQLCLKRTEFDLAVHPGRVRTAPGDGGRADTSPGPRSSGSAPERDSPKPSRAVLPAVVEGTAASAPLEGAVQDVEGDRQPEPVPVLGGEAVMHAGPEIRAFRSSAVAA